MKKVYLIFFLGIVLILFFTTCRKKNQSDKENQTPPHDSIQYELTDNARIPSKMGNLLNTSIDSNKITLTYKDTAPQFSIGMIILDTISQGYLRKITGIQLEGSNIILTTTNTRSLSHF